MPAKKDVIFNSGFTGCNDRMAILKNETVQKDLSDYSEVLSTNVGTDMYVYVDDAGKPSKIRLGEIITSNAVQPDWAEKDTTSYAYIRNKPADLVIDEDIVSLYNIGGINAGQLFKAGTAVTDIIKKLLYTNAPVTLRFGLIPGTDKIPETITELITALPKPKSSIDNIA